MIGNLIAALIAVVLKRFPKDVVKDLIDGLLDKVEDHIQATPTPYDDMILNPLIGAIREYCDIPDNDDLVQ